MAMTVEKLTKIPTFLNIFMFCYCFWYQISYTSHMSNLVDFVEPLIHNSYIFLSFQPF